MHKPGWIGFLLLSLLSVSCGGGGDGYGGNPAPPTGWVMGVFPPSQNFDALCLQPRTGIDPTTNQPFPDVAGTSTDENNWLRSWTNELYLWYQEVPDLDPALHATPAYFDLMMTSAATPSGNPKDQFHFTFPTSDWIALAQSGVQIGYGATWIILAATPPRQVMLAYTEPNSPATAPAANLMRGAEVLEVDGVDLVNANDQTSVDTLNAGLFPATDGEAHDFVIRDLGSQTTRSLTLTSDEITSVPVQNVSTFTTPTGIVGYMLFNDHIATAESALISAVSTLQAQGITDLVLDIRYNGGGFLDIASELAFMIAGPGGTTGQTFELLQFNDKHPTTNPVTGDPIVPIPFHSTSLGFSPTVPQGQPLPTLNLSRVFVLTGPSTCSASESIMNSLRGVDVEVIQIGSTTCGKPYGFYPTDNCGITYFSIQFKGVNAKDFGDYADGFSPQNTISTAGVLVPGCSVADDFSHALGDQDEGRVAAALDYRDSLTCPVPPSGIALQTLDGAPFVTDAQLYKSPWHENRILRR